MTHSVSLSLLTLFDPDYQFSVELFVHTTDTTLETVQDKAGHIVSPQTPELPTDIR